MMHMFSISNLAACARRFFTFGAFGSVTRDFVAKRNLLAIIDTLLSSVTIRDCDPGSFAVPAISIPLLTKSS